MKYALQLETLDKKIRQISQRANLHFDFSVSSLRNPLKLDSTVVEWRNTMRPNLDLLLELRLGVILQRDQLQAIQQISSFTNRLSRNGLGFI